MGPNGWTANSPSTAEHRDLRLATSNSRMLKSSRLQWRWFSWFIISNNWWHQNMLPRGLRFTPGALPGIIRMIVTTKKTRRQALIDSFANEKIAKRCQIWFPIPGSLIPVVCCLIPCFPQTMIQTITPASMLDLSRGMSWLMWKTGGAMLSHQGPRTIPWTSKRQLSYPMTDPWSWYINANMTGVYWWDLCYHIYIFSIHGSYGYFQALLS